MKEKGLWHCYPTHYRIKFVHIKGTQNSSFSAIRIHTLQD